MKPKIILIFALILTTVLAANAQEVRIDGISYEVKGERILKNGVDATDNISEALKERIKQAAIEKRAAFEAADKVEKDLKKAEKKQKKEEKKRKKAERALKQKEKAQSKFAKSTKKYESAQKKYDKLKKKGKLSPQDEEKWLSKIDKLKTKAEKAKRKLK